MTALRFTREAIRVEAMRLEGLGDLVIARQWLEDHGIKTHIAAGRVMVGYDDSDIRLNASLGQWLVYEPGSGYFDVVDGDEHAPDGCTGGLASVDDE